MREALPRSTIASITSNPFAEGTRTFAERSARHEDGPLAVPVAVHGERFRKGFSQPGSGIEAPYLAA